MGTTDLSRAAQEPAKRYLGVRAQMGRVLSDDDLNDNEDIHDEATRRLLHDVIGPTGAPGGGMFVSSPAVVGGKVDFTIGAGRFYLGGMALEVDEDEQFLQQTDWLDQAPADQPAAPSTSRFDLVWIEAFLQEVTAVEDSELFEVALGARDTTTRVRPTRRIHVSPDIGSNNCRDGWGSVLADPAVAGTVGDDLELVTDASLAVAFTPGSSAGDLCSPSVAGGFLGADNQAIRVQLVDAGHLTWGFDNASSLYRVNLATDASGSRVVVKLQTHPTDQAHWPRAGQVVELLPWAAVLSNGEKVAERHGLLDRVATSFDPTTGSLTITNPVPAAWGAEWKARADAAELAPEFFYLRVWDRGADVASAPAIPFTPGVPLTLGTTGLSVTISGTTLRTDDHWIIAARPEAPDVVTPWSLKTGRPPHGYRRWIAPLGVIEWEVSGGAVTGKLVDDCRQTFPPLTRQRSCCTYTVGDGVTSFGQFDVIQDAIDALPVEGGEICLLPGRFVQRFRIVGRSNVRVHGCGRRTVLVAPDERRDSIVVIAESQGIDLYGFSIEADLEVGILLAGSPSEPTVLDVELRELRIRCGQRPAIWCQSGVDIRVLSNEIDVMVLDRERLRANLPLEAAVVMAGANLLIERNSIGSAAAVPTFLTPLGGLQINGGSEHIEIRRNRIIGGNGNGITLGSIVWLDEAEAADLSTFYIDVMRGARSRGGILWIDEDGCTHYIPPDGDPPSGDDPTVPISEGPVLDVRIIDNHIARMGVNGIATVTRPQGTRGRSTVANLEIADNRILDNLVLDVREDARFQGLSSVAFGGISLSSVRRLLVRDNAITGNGVQHSSPVCGVYVDEGRDLCIRGNRIAENGVSLLRAGPGARGGIVIDRAAADIGLAQIVNPQAVVAVVEAVDGRSVAGAPRPAVRIADNEVMSPCGPALSLIGMGAFSIEHNFLSAIGAPGLVRISDDSLRSRPLGYSFGRAASDVADGKVLRVVDGSVDAIRSTTSPATVSAALLALGGGSAVTVFNLGRSPEFGTVPAAISWARVAVKGQLSSKRSFAGRSVRSVGPGAGPILFDDNQVHLEANERESLVCSVLIYGLDDLGFSGNQCSTDTLRSLTTDAALAAWSIRATGNRFKEPMGSSYLSALTVGTLNSTVDNHATHCIWAIGTLLVDSPNLIHAQIGSPDECRRLSRLPRTYEAIGTIPNPEWSVAQPSGVTDGFVERDPVVSDPAGPVEGISDGPVTYSTLTGIPTASTDL